MSGENAAPLQAAAAEVTPAALAAAAALLAQANPNGAKGKGKKKGGGSRWKEREVVAMLGFVREVLPRGVTEWELVAAKYAEWVDENGAPHRDKDAVKNKYQTLKNTQKSTGDPECPSTVREAKHIARDIEAKGECGAVEDEAAAEREEEEEEEELDPEEGEGENVEPAEKEGVEGRDSLGASSAEGTGASPVQGGGLLGNLTGVEQLHAQSVSGTATKTPSRSGTPTSIASASTSGSKKPLTTLQKAQKQLQGKQWSTRSNVASALQSSADAVASMGSAGAGEGVGAAIMQAMMLQQESTRRAEQQQQQQFMMWMQQQEASRRAEQQQNMMMMMGMLTSINPNMAGMMPFMMQQQQQPPPGQQTMGGAMGGVGMQDPGAGGMGVGVKRKMMEYEEDAIGHSLPQGEGQECGELLDGADDQ
mmetsp:Transcript_5848/g.13808  ORF Transcript_5848/g.13808 Transcript_5848/m.13808 type:complete len:421 (+) Transcript_5848:85-1347(+)